ncbi:MAG: heparinase II/III family protein, partial [Candidatus Latescibacteria bacterium]|nr:heparinase II/III family protein [Candidatus Latescibacterota bacterium]
IGEKRINNKSVGNRIAAGLVGVSLGHPGLVRFGLAGWALTLETWFLADGCTPESPGYALMALGGIYAFPQALRDYSDPPGYVDEDGKRIDGLDLYGGQYKRIWQRMFEGLQGNLCYPPYADTRRTAQIGARFAELLAANYPDNLQYLALLKAHAGEDLANGDHEAALFFREPGLEHKGAPSLHFEDDLFPVLCLGQLRTGERGERSLVLLSATHWGGHHHRDSLNLYYWKDGQELLTDLGYLWDHPDSGMTRRGFAHNTGMVDLKEQKTEGRGGYFHLFHTGDRVKVMEASSRAYDGAGIYRRTVVQVDHGAGDSYVLDIFRLQADGARQLVYHGPNSDYAVAGIDLHEGATTCSELDLENTKSACSPGTWSVEWRMADDVRFSAFHCGQQAEMVTIGDGWGQRDHLNTDLGVALPYIVRSHKPEAGISTFCTVYEAHRPNAGLVKSVSRLTGPECGADTTVALEIETSSGVDLVISQFVPMEVEVEASV